MADEIITQPATPAVTIESKPNPVEERITDLSSKVKTASEERDAARAEAEAAKKTAAFANEFVDIAAEFPAAREHKADIEAKVMAGYSPKDAAFAVLGAAGKLGTPKVERQPVVGGSAPTTISLQGGNKNIEEMTRDEKRSALLEAQRKGDLGLS